MSVIRQKGKSQNGCFKKTKHAKFSEKTNIFYPLICTQMCVYQGVKNVCFLENLACFVFLKHQFWNLPFCLITNEITLCFYFPQLFPLVYKTGNKKSKSSYLFLYLFIYLKQTWARVYLKSLNWVTREALQSCKLRIWEFL